MNKPLSRSLYALTDPELIPPLTGQPDIRAATQAYASLFEESCP